MLQFHLFGFPVSVHFFFFITAGLIGPKSDIVAIALWIAMVFVGVLLHELGHAGAARSFGLEPAILLHGMGGLTSWRASRNLNTWQRLALSGSGPAVGIVVGATALVVYHTLGPEIGTPTERLLAYAARVNLGWGVLNLFPVLPLDGGQIATTLTERVFGPKGRTVAIVLSLAFLVALALWSIWAGELWISILAVVLAVSNYQALGLKPRRQPPREAPTPTDAERAYDVARTMAIEGDRDEALEWLEVAVGAGFASTSALDGDPAWSELRFHPRYADLRRRMTGG